MSAPRSSIRVRVLLFARFAEMMDTTAMDLTLSHPATIASVLDLLRAAPRGHLLPPAPLVARNQEHARLDTPLGDGDEVAVLPPLAGG